MPKKFWAKSGSLRWPTFKVLYKGVVIKPHSIGIKANTETSTTVEEPQSKLLCPQPNEN